MRMTGKLRFLALAIVLVAAPAMMYADSNLGMQMSSSPNSVTLCDNNVDFAGCTHNSPDLNSNLGQITFFGGVGGWTTNITSGFGPPYENLVPVLDVSSFNATATAGSAPMTVLLSVTGLTSVQGIQSVLASIGGTSTLATATISTQAWLSTSNTAFCASTSCGTAITSLLTVSGRSFNGTMSGTGNFGSGGPFALTLAVTIDNHGLADQISFDDELDIQVPEKSSWSILGVGLLGLFVGFRKNLQSC